MFKFIGRIFGGITFLSLVLLLVACFAPKVSPQTNWLVAFAGLGFPVFFAINAIWIIIWFFFKRKYLVVPIIGLLISIPNASRYVSYQIDNQLKLDKQDDISILTYNVKVFDLYNWSKNGAGKQTILSAIDKANADVICLQEFYTDATPDFNTKKELNKKYPYYFVHPTLTKNGHRQWGLATFSKYPIIQQKAISFPNSKHNLALQTTIEVKGDTVSIINLHLQSVHFGEEDYASLESPEMKNASSILDALKKLKEAFEKRATQAEQMAEIVTQSDHPVLVVGDMNDTPNSYAYKTISKGLNDSFSKAGWGLKTTYKGRLPLLRIDHILGSEEVLFRKYKVIEEGESDHYPVLATFSLNEKAK